LQIVIVAALAKGVKSALALRERHPGTRRWPAALRVTRAGPAARIPLLAIPFTMPRADEIGALLKIPSGESWRYPASHWRRNRNNPFPHWLFHGVQAGWRTHLKDREQAFDGRLAHVEHLPGGEHFARGGAGTNVSGCDPDAAGKCLQ
jgi:hypothetical protein